MARAEPDLPLAFGAAADPGKPRGGEERDRAALANDRPYRRAEGSGAANSLCRGVQDLRRPGDPCRVILDPPTLRRRLLLRLYGLGTNAGLKRLSAGTEDVTYAELLHVRRRFIDRETLRAAT